MEYTFILKYQLAESDSDPDVLVDVSAVPAVMTPWWVSGSRVAWRLSSPAKLKTRRPRCAVRWPT